VPYTVHKTVDQKTTVCYNSYTVNKQPKEGTMKKILISAVAIATLAASSVAAAQGYNRGYNQGYNNSAAWNSAAIGAAGMITGAIVSGIMQNNANQNSAQVYGQAYGGGYAPPMAYGPPPGVVPVYPAPPVVYGGYYQPRACVTTRVPQYDAYGRVVQFIQMCAN
jgi:hypothetical protein